MERLYINKLEYTTRLSPYTHREETVYQAVDTKYPQFEEYISKEKYDVAVEALKRCLDLPAKRALEVLGEI